jgi:glucose/arabinose dehydrogenase
LIGLFLGAHALAGAQEAPEIELPDELPGVEVDLSGLVVQPTALDFGSVAMGSRRTLGLILRNASTSPLELRSIAFLRGASGDSAAFELTLGERRFAGGTEDVLRTFYPVITLAHGASLGATLTFEPQVDQLDEFVLRWTSSIETVEVPVRALGGHFADHFLHVVIDGPDLAVDYDGDGSEPLTLDGSASHTHEAGQAVTGFEWRRGKNVLGSGPGLETVLTEPFTEIRLRIADDHEPPETLDGFFEARLATPANVPGVLARYHGAPEGGASALLDAELGAPDFVERRADLVLSGALQVGGSPFTGGVLVQFVGRLALERPGMYGFAFTGGAGHRLFLDGKPFMHPRLLLPGEHALELRFAVDTLADLPLALRLSVEGNGEAIRPDQLSHDQTGEVPALHALTEIGGALGGEAIVLQGFGFFPAAEVVVHWGSEELTAAELVRVTPTEIELLSPPGVGAVEVAVLNPNGRSRSRLFTYRPGEETPVRFRREREVPVPSATAGAWASDGKLYVVSLEGTITALEFDGAYQLLSQATFPGVSALPNHEALALTVNPFDPPSPVRLYVGHGDHFLHDGEIPEGPSPYTGQVSVLEGPDFSTPIPLVTGLAVSNNTHAINALAFDDNGDLLISVGSLTNAGVQHPGLGGLPESPLSAAVLKARLSKPDFNGAITYVETLTGLPNDDQLAGERVDVASGVDVEVHAAGFRNAVGLVYTTRGRLYATDNGPNMGYGPASTGPDTQASDPTDSDELNLVEWGNYYGFPNRSRGRSDPRQHIFRGGASGPASIPETFFQMVAELPSSSDGLDEYRAETFGGALRGDLIVQKFLGRLQRVGLSEDGRSLAALELLDPTTRGLGCATGPDGALVSFDYSSGEVEVLVADEEFTIGLRVHDIFPWRAPAEGGMPFILSGRGFGELETTEVRFGGRLAELTEVSSTRIRGLVPPEPAPTGALLDVVVSVGPEQNTLGAAFRYLFPAGHEPGRWTRHEDAGVELAAAAAGVLDGTMLLVGFGSRQTLAYDLQARRWLANVAPRPFAGLYHSAEVLGGKLYLVGGLGGGTEGRLQVFHPGLNAWTSGAGLPWPAGAVATAVIGGRIYAAGGFTVSGTEGRTARYDPEADAWTPLAPMPAAVSHAAAGTDGVRLFVFGGRTGIGEVVNGFDFVQIYDPESDSWSWSGDPGSGLAPLPEGRSGMGKALYLRGEFHVIGGEALEDPDANPAGVYSRVDVYDPRANTWRSEAPLPTARHGVAAVLFQGHVFVAGGATRSGLASSSVLESFTRQ